MSLTLGEKLRQAREARGITISEVAEQTRISALYLEAIENNDYRTLPGGIFNKGFVKSYGKHVGSQQEVLQDYAALITEQGSNANDEPKTYRPEVLTDERSRYALLPTLLFSFIILGLMVWGIMALLRYYQDSQNQPVAETNVNKNVNANVATPLPTPISTNEIKVEFKALSNQISLSYATDNGKFTPKNVAANESVSLTAQQSLKLSYYKGFGADKVQLTVNGKQITPPSPPAKGNNIVFEINKDNIQQILQSGSIGTPASTNPTPNVAVTPAVVSTPRSTPRVTPTPTRTATPVTPPVNTRVNGNTNTRP